MKKILALVWALFYFLCSFGQAVEGDSCGHQLKNRVPTTAFHSTWRDSTWALTWLPREYKDSTTKHYPLILFCHGSGEGDPNYFTDNANGSQLCILNNNALPAMISAGLQPSAVSGGNTYKFIVISLQMWSGGSPGYAALFYALPYITSKYRIDTNRIYVTGLSEGGYGTWDVLTNGTDTTFIKNKIAAIIPQSAVTLEAVRIPFLHIASRDTIPALVPCGTADLFITSSTANVDTINTSVPTPYVPAILLPRPGLAHVPAAWDSIYSMTFRPAETGGLNGYEWMLQYVQSPRGPLNPNAPPTANAGGNKSITLPTSSVTLSGSGTGQNGATISSYAWMQTSGPTTASLAGSATATLTASGLIQGSYVFTITVTDNHGNTGSNAATVTVNAAPVNTPPNVNAGPNQNIFLPTTSTTLTGTASGNNGASIAAVTWTLSSYTSTPCTIVSSSSLSTLITGMTVGTYVFTFTAQDNTIPTGLTNSSSVTVVVSPASTFVNRYWFGCGEYGNFGYDQQTGHAYIIQGDTVFVAGTPSRISNIGDGAHHHCLIDSVGNVLCFGDNSAGQIGNGTISGTVNTMYKIATDSSGNPFTNVIDIKPTGSVYGYYTAARKSDGTVWAWGDLRGGIRGNGTYGQISPKPVQIKFPAGVFIKKIAMSVAALALDANGGVWSWGDSGQVSAPYLLAQGTLTPVTNTPTKITLPSAAIDISGGSDWCYSILSNHSLYGWAFHAGYLAIGDPTDSNFSHPVASTSPILLDTGTKFQAPIDSIYTNNVGSYGLLADSTVWFWGNNDEGGTGDGTSLNWASYADPYNWNQVPTTLYRKPHQVGAGLHSFTRVFTSNSLCFYAILEDINNTVYVVGRDKGGVLGTGVINCDSVSNALPAHRPDSWNRPYLTIADPLHQSTTSRTSSPYCVTVPANADCAASNCIASLAAPLVSAGSNQVTTGSTAQLIGFVSPATGAKINYELWTCTGKPGGAANPLIVIPSMNAPQATGLFTPGVYTFQLTATDNNWRSSSSTMTVTVGAAGCNCLQFNYPTKFQ